jgi:sulfite exporter TauE/SafE
MSITVLVSAWLVGALGGVHCIAMCGGLLSAVAARDANRVATLRPAAEIARRQFAYHAGRLATYALLGALFGAAGAATLGAVSVLPLQRALYVAANVLVVLLGASLAFRAATLAPLQQAGLRAFAPVLRGLQPLLLRPGASGRIALGFAWGFMPCAMIYGVLPLALLSGGAWQGAAVMLAFGLGTLPNLLAVGVLLARTRRLLSARALRHAGAAVLIAFGLFGLWRIAWAPGDLAQGAFCLLP